MGVRYVSVRKRGARMDGWNYVTTCHVCSGSKGDVSGVSGVTKERADELREIHIRDVHHGQRTL